MLFTLLLSGFHLALLHVGPELLDHIYTVMTQSARNVYLELRPSLIPRVRGVLVFVPLDVLPPIPSCRSATARVDL